MLTAPALHEPPRPNREAVVRPLAGTLVWRAGQHALGELGARRLVIVADPIEAAIRVYRSVGFADHETQLSMHSAPS